MTTAIHVPYVDYEIESVRNVMISIYQTRVAVEQSAENLRSHWEGLPTHLSGTSVAATGFYSAMTYRTKSADDLAAMLSDLWTTLDNYADNAKTPLEHLARLQQEAIEWQSRRPMTVMSAPDTPIQDIWAMQAGYAPGTVCMTESPFTAWERERTRIEAEVTQWAREYERVAEECAAALRRIQNPTMMWWWDHLGGSNPSRKNPAFSYGDNTARYRSANDWGFEDGYRARTDGTWTYGPDGERRYVNNLDAEQEGDGSGNGRSDYFGWGVQGVNVSGENIWGAHGDASTSYGNPDGVHGDLSASGTAGLYSEGSAGVNMQDGRVVAGVSGEAVAGVRGEAAGSVEYGYVHASGRAEASAGAMASGRANVSGGVDGVKANIGGELFAGAQASAGVKGGVSGVDLGAGVTGYAGIGVKGDVDLSFSADSVKVDVDVGAALGIGGGVKFSVDVNPKKIVEDIGNLFGF